MSADHDRSMIAPWLAAPLRANARAYGEVAVAAALINLFGFATSLFSMTVYDRVVPGGATNSLIALSIGMAIVLVFDFALRSLRGRMIDHAGARVDRMVGEALFARVLALPLGERRGSTGSFTAALREFETLRDFLASATLAVLVDVPFSLLFLGGVALIGGSLALVTAAMIPLVLGVALVSERALTRLTARAAEGSRTRQGIMVETVGALETVRSVGAGPMLAERWRVAVRSAARAAADQRRIGARALNIAGSAQSLAYVGTIAIGVGLIERGGLTTGAVVACSLLASRAVSPLGGLANLLVRFAHARAAYRALDRVIGGAAPKRPHATEARTPEEGASGFVPAIVLENVHFAYPHGHGNALAGVSLAVEPGERLGILGRSGSGKSTFARLLLGLYAPAHGRVWIGGAEPACVEAGHHVGVCPQEPVLFTGTVRDNIALGRPWIDAASIVRAAAIAGLGELLGPGGLDHVVADRGEGLSGGQRQAIALARALAGEPPLLILDEPTASLDAASEAAMIDRLLASLGGRTLIVITHQPPLLRLVDRVILLDAGRIALDGPRDAVLRRLTPAQPVATAPAVNTPITDPAGSARAPDARPRSASPHAPSIREAA